MKRIRIYTEGTSWRFKSAADHAARVFDGFTVYKAEGYWKGTPEESVIIEIIGDSGDVDKAKGLAQYIKADHEQESVLVTVETIKGEFI